MKLLIAIVSLALGSQFLMEGSARAEEVKVAKVLDYIVVGDSVIVYDGDLNKTRIKKEDLLTPPFEVVYHPEKRNLVQYSTDYWIPKVYVELDDKARVVTDQNCLIRELKSRQKDNTLLSARMLSNCGG